MKSLRDIFAWVSCGLLLILAAFALSACQSVFSGIGASGTPASAEAAPRIAEIRAGNGLAALRPDPALERAAMAQASDMASSRRMTHNARRDFPSRMRSNGIRGAAAENIAHGRFDTPRVISVWMNSDGHRRNMLDERFSRFGLAYVPDPKDPSRRYWAMVLGE
jgi:uncharacterized protein YkwD